MKKRSINYSWPAELFDFKQDTNKKNFSRGKLKVFYKGETGDKRFFSDKFSEELIKSLPYSPVVGYYDEEEDDFVGHATQQQVFGCVDPCVEPIFKEIDGQEWAICDVVLYTERPDKVGDIAKKIVGHKQSLEMDPRTVEYKINYDEKKHFKNIEFTAGTIVGVSVLGENQKPAFTGSEFFAYNEQFESKMQILRDYCNHVGDQTNGGSTMNLQEFMTLSWGEISSKVGEAIFTEYQNEYYTYVVDMFEDCAIVRFYSYLDGSSKLMRVKYVVSEDGAIELGNVNEVYVSYNDYTTTTEEEAVGVSQATEMEDSETLDLEVTIDQDENECQEQFEEVVVEEVEETIETEEFEEITEEAQEVVEETVSEEEHFEEVEELQEEVVEEENNLTDVAEEQTEVVVAEEAQVTNAEVTEIVEMGVEDENTETKETSGSTSFTESERAEFEALKREKKLNLLNSYKQHLSDEEYATFSLGIDSFDFTSLECELLKAYKAKTEQVKPVRTKRPFAFGQVLNNARKETTTEDDLVAKYLRR